MFVTSNKLCKLAKLLVDYSCSLNRNEKVLIESIDTPIEFIEILIENIYRKGAYPFLSLKSTLLMRAIGLKAKGKYYNVLADSELYHLKKMDAFIGIKKIDNPYELSDIPDNNLKQLRNQYLKPVHYEYRNNNLKWVYLRWPSASMAQRADMSTSAFYDYYFNACLVDYEKMAAAMRPLCKWIDKTNLVHIVGPGKTDLRFSIQNLGHYSSYGKINIPDGEVFTAPIKHSVNGMIEFNIPSIFQGVEFRNVCFEVKNGKIIEARSDINDEKLNKILNQDKGARYFGEFAFGINPIITKPIREIIFDEKINTSIHLAVGNAYKAVDNGNRSATHWDLILDQTADNGGGEVYFDKMLTRKNGKFVIDELIHLNSENLLKEIKS